MLFVLRATGALIYNPSAGDLRQDRRIRPSGAGVVCLSSPHAVAQNAGGPAWIPEQSFTAHWPGMGALGRRILVVTTHSLQTLCLGQASQNELCSNLVFSLAPMKHALIRLSFVCGNGPDRNSSDSTGVIADFSRRHRIPNLLQATQTKFAYSIAVRKLVLYEVGYCKHPRWSYSRTCQLRNSSTGCSVLRCHQDGPS